MSIQFADKDPIATSVFPAAVNRSEGQPPSIATRWHLVFGIVLAIEFLVVAGAISASSTVYYYTTFGVFPSALQALQIADTSILVAVFFTLLSLGFRHHSVMKFQQFHVLLWSGIGTVAVAFALLVSTLFLAKISDGYSRGAFLFQIAGVGIAICAFRSMLNLWFQIGHRCRRDRIPSCDFDR